MEFRYTFEPYRGKNSREICPQCKSQDRTLVPYIDTQTGERLGSEFGKCNRIQKCGYWMKPDGLSQESLPYDPNTERKKGVIPYELVKPTLSPDHWHKNNFVRFLLDRFDNATVKEVIQKYFVGTNRQNGATIFWHCNHQWQFTQGQIIHYLPNGHRDKNQQQSSTPALLKKANLIDAEADYEQVLFGEHLLREDKGLKTQNIGLFEAPKTAIIAACKGVGTIDTYLSYIALEGLTGKKIEPVKESFYGKSLFLFNDYHFEARMVNGLLPMKKKAGKMDLEGEAVEGYTNKRELLRFYLKDFSKITLVDSPRGAGDESGDDLADIITYEPELLKNLDPYFQEKDENQKGELCQICSGIYSPFFISKYNGLNVCIDCINEIYIPDPKAKKKEKTVQGIIEQLTNKNPALSLLIEKLALEPTTNNVYDLFTP